MTVYESILTQYPFTSVSAYTTNIYPELAHSLQESNAIELETNIVESKIVQGNLLFVTLTVWQE